MRCKGVLCHRIVERGILSAYGHGGGCRHAISFYRRLGSRRLSVVDRSPGPTLPNLATPARWALLFGALCIFALVLSPPFLGGYADMLRWVLHPVCHQIPERSFHVLGEPLALCHRCTGLSVGFTLGIALWPSIPKLAGRLAAKPRLLGFFFVPLVVDWLVVENTAGSRFVTGAIAAFPVALLPLLAIAQRGQHIRSSLETKE